VKNARCLATPVSAMDVVTVMVIGAMMTVVMVTGAIMTIVVHVFADNVVDEIRDLIDAEVAAFVFIDVIEVLFGAVFVQLAFSIEVGAADEIEFAVASVRFLLMDHFEHFKILVVVDAP